MSNTQSTHSEGTLPFTPKQLETLMAAIVATDAAYAKPTPENLARVKKLLNNCDDITFSLVKGDSPPQTPAP